MRVQPDFAYVRFDGVGREDPDADFKMTRFIPNTKRHEARTKGAAEPVIKKFLTVKQTNKQNKTMM